MLVLLSKAEVISIHRSRLSSIAQNHSNISITSLVRWRSLVLSFEIFSWYCVNTWRTERRYWIILPDKTGQKITSERSERVVFSRLEGCIFRYLSEGVMYWHYYTAKFLKKSSFFPSFYDTGSITQYFPGGLLGSSVVMINTQLMFQLGPSTVSCLKTSTLNYIVHRYIHHFGCNNHTLVCLLIV